MPYIEVAKGVNLFVQDWGAGKPIVFVHGWPLSYRIFEYQMTALAQRGHRAVGIDLRGFGQSDKPWDGNDYDTWVGDVAKVIKALDLKEVALAGFSMGGAIATHYAATQNDRRVTKLALLGAAAPASAARPDFPQGLPPETLNGFLRGLLADQAKFMSEFVKAAFHNPLSPEISRWYEAMGTKASLRACVRGLEELRDRYLRAEMDNIRIPARIFHGVHDQVAPFATAEVQQQLIQGATLVRFENSGHGLFHDEKDKLTEELAKFAAEKLERLAA